MSSRATIPEYQPLGDMKALARCVTRCRRHESPGALCHPMPKASGDITRQGFRVTLGLIFWYVTLEAM